MSNSWTVADATQAIEHSGLTNDSIIIDPFGGCGTTAFAANLLGISAITSDNDPIATLFALTNQTNFSKIYLETKECIENFELKEVLCKSIESESDLALKSYVVNELLNSHSWQGETLDTTRFPSSCMTLDFHHHISFDYSVLLTNIAALPNILPTIIKEKYSKTGIVSSPPFYGSNSNPKQIVIAELISESVQNYINDSKLPDIKIKCMQRIDSILSNMDLQFWYAEQVIRSARSINAKVIAYELGIPACIFTIELEELSDLISEIFINHGFKVSIAHKFSNKSDIGHLLIARSS